MQRRLIKLRKEAAVKIHGGFLRKGGLIMYDSDGFRDGFSDELTTLEKNQAAKTILAIQDKEAKRCTEMIVFFIIAGVLMLAIIAFVLYTIFAKPEEYLEEVAREQELYGYHKAAGYNSLKNVVWYIAFVPFVVLLTIKNIHGAIEDKRIWNTYRVVKARVAEILNNRAILELSDSKERISLIISAEEKRKLEYTDSIVLINFNGYFVKTVKDEDGTIIYQDEGRTKYYIIFADLNSI